MIHDFHPEARLEYREAAIFYDGRRTGSGAAFSLEIEATIERIKEAPERWPVVEQDVRKCLTHVFPYSILYTIEQDGDSYSLGDAPQAEARPLARTFVRFIRILTLNRGTSQSQRVCNHRHRTEAHRCGSNHRA